MRLFRTFNAPLENSFTVVYWEQHGTDKSTDRKIPVSSMTIEQLSRWSSSEFGFSMWRFREQFKQTDYRSDEKAFHGSFWIGRFHCICSLITVNLPAQLGASYD